MTLTSLIPGRARRRRGAEALGATLPWLVLPLVLIVLAVLIARPELMRLSRALPPLGLALTLAAVPLAFVAEYLLTALATYRKGAPFLRGIALEPFWKGELRLPDHACLLLIVVGEEMVFRQLWMGVLIGSLGVAPIPALLLSSFAYGLNHLFFGPLAVASKSLTGLIYGGLFLFGGHNVWLPILAHALQNYLLLLLTARRGAVSPAGASGADRG